LADGVEARRRVLAGQDYIARHFTPSVIANAWNEALVSTGIGVRNELGGGGLLSLVLRSGNLEADALSRGAHPEGAKRPVELSGDFRRAPGRMGARNGNAPRRIRAVLL